MFQLLCKRGHAAATALADRETMTIPAPVKQDALALIAGLAIGVALLLAGVA